MDAAADEGGTLARRHLASLKPIIGAINGHAVGIGLSMTLSMDFRLVAEGAKLGFVFARRGIVPEACSTFLFPRLVGHGQAAEWLYTGRPLHARGGPRRPSGPLRPRGRRPPPGRPRAAAEGVSSFLDHRSPDLPLEVSQDFPDFARGW